MYHSEMVSLRLTSTLLERVDAQRGGTPRSAYLRKIIENSIAAETHIETGGFVPEYVGPAVETVSPNVPAPAVDAAGKIDVPSPPARHLHRYSQREHVGYAQGTKTHRWECICGAEKVQ
jgi:hypothetical protein